MTAAAEGQGRLALIAAGGTGGHLFPAQALAEVLLGRGWRVALSTDARGARYAGGFPDAVARMVVPSATPARGGLLARALVPTRLTAGVLAALVRMRRDRPSVVIGFGGYPAFPAMAAAGVLGVPRLVHEQNGVMGRVNAAFARRVTAVACGTWPATLPAGVTGTPTGNPVRAAIRAVAGAPYAPPTADGPLHLLVIGGSQGARILSDIVPAAVAALPADARARLRVAHQARDEDAVRAADTYAAAGVEAEIAPFFADVADRLVAAQLVVSRAGASSLADLTVIGRPAILIPYAAAAGDHQSANARALDDAGAAEVLPESVLDARSLSRDLHAILTDPARATRMAAAARACGRPDAAAALATLVSEIAA